MVFRAHRLQFMAHYSAEAFWGGALYQLRWKASFYEPIANAPNGDDAAGGLRVGLNFLPQPVDKDITPVRGNELFVYPRQNQ